MQSLIEIGPLVLERKKLKLKQFFFVICQCTFDIFFEPHLGKGRGLSFEKKTNNKFDSYLSKDAMCQVEIGPVVL